MSTLLMRWKQLARTFNRSWLLIPLLLVAGTGSAAANQRTVFTSSNAAAGNTVLVYERSFIGSLSLVRSVNTGGLGTGAGLGSQGALAIGDNGRWLFVVNAGSDEISTFAVLGSHLKLLHKVHSGGATPISLTVHRDLLYVLNAGGNIAGFKITHFGRLDPIAGSIRSLTGSGVGPAQIQFDPRGETLVVTEKGTNKIDVFPVVDGIAQDAVVQNSNGATPFGFDFDRRGHLVVSEAFGGAPNSSALSSYDLDDTTLSLISGSVPTGQTAACWVVITNNGRFAYTTNTGSGSVSGYRIARNGKLNLLTPDGRTGVIGEASAPTDMALTLGSHFLLVAAPGAGTITSFRVRFNGTLATADSIGGLPASAAGLIAR
jgi:6-phosphogluconolactonase